MRSLTKLPVHGQRFAQRAGNARQPGPAFLPSSASGCALNIDPQWGGWAANPGSSAIYPCPIGDALNVINGRGGVSFTQSTYAIRSTLQVVNGRLVVRFDGVGDYMSATPPAGAPTGTQPLTMISASSVTNSAFGGVIGQGDGTSYQRFAVVSSTSETSIAFTGCRFGISSGSSSMRVISAIAAGTQCNTCVLRINGAQQASSVVSGSNGTRNLADTIWTIGNTQDLTNYIAGDIGPQLIFFRGMSDSEMLRAERYVGQRVGVQL